MPATRIAMRMRLLGLGCLAVLTWPCLAQASEAADSVQKYLVGRPDLILCLTYSIVRSESLHDELVRRNLLNAADVKALSTRAMTGGMSECGLLAVRGRPLRIAHGYEHIFEIHGQIILTAIAADEIQLVRLTMLCYSCIRPHLIRFSKQPTSNCTYFMPSERKKLVCLDYILHLVHSRQ